MKHRKDDWALANAKELLDIFFSSVVFVTYSGGQTHMHADWAPARNAGLLIRLKQAKQVRHVFK